MKLKTVMVAGAALIMLSGCAQTRWVNRYADSNNERQYNRDIYECETIGMNTANMSGARQSLVVGIYAGIQAINCMQSRGWYKEQIR
jgi:hypothetical protein